MSFRVPDRIHIMPVGFEKDRIVDAANELKADRVVLVTNVDDTEEGKKYSDDVKTSLSDQGFSIEEVTCDIFDLYDTIGTVSMLIRDFAEEDVYVNISTGSKVTAIGCMISAMIFDATTYYVKAEDYSGSTPEGVVDITELPTYRIEAPDPTHITVLDYLRDVNKDGITKGELIDFAEEKGFHFIANKDVSKKAKYRLIDNHIIEPLITDDYLEIKQDGRSRIVSISDKGEDLVDAFGFLAKQGHLDSNHLVERPA